jgi:ubiquinone/menaquinone biosynthesis C-methylase UbiE
VSNEIERFYTEIAGSAYEKWAGGNGGYHYGYFDPPLNVKKRQIEDIPGLHLQSLQRMQRNVANFMQLDTANVILDMGCGEGGMFPNLCNLQRTLIGVNMVSRQLRRAQQRVEALHLNAALLECDFQQLDLLEDGVADRILFMESFNHSTDQQQALAESYRLLSKSGGQLVIVEPMLNGRELDEAAQQRLEMLALGKKMRPVQHSDLVVTLEELNMQVQSAEITQNVLPSMLLAANGARAQSQGGSVHLDVYNNREATIAMWELAWQGALSYYMVRATARG